MKVSLNWLKEYLDIPSDPIELSSILTSLGLEVEGMDEVMSIPGGLEGLVVGEVLSCHKHPNADKLSITDVNVGQENSLQIVCGAPNVAAGQKVVVAQVGTTLYPTEGDPFKIKKGKIRGEASEGMICAEDEIGLGTEHDGIIVLPEKTHVGQLVSEVYEIEKDVIYDIGLTPNRSDATSHLGVAKDLLAYYRFHIDPSLQLKLPEQSSHVSSDDSFSLKVTVKDAMRCPRFSGVVLEKLELGPSPKWMQQRLLSIGVRPINNVIDSSSAFRRSNNCFIPYIGKS